MTGFGNDNNNENQDFGTLNMGSGSMFSEMPNDIQSADIKNKPNDNKAIPRVSISGISREQSVEPEVQHTAQAPQLSPAPQPKVETKEELDDEVITVKPIRFASFENEISAVGTPKKNLDIMQDVKAKITVELGRCKMKVKKVLDIQKGSIIEINKVAGEQVELFVCGKPVAHGEVIVIEDKFGLRITSIMEDKSL